MVSARTMKMKGTTQEPSAPLKRKSHIRLLTLAAGRLRAQAGNTMLSMAPDSAQCRQLASSSLDLCHLCHIQHPHDHTDICRCVLIIATHLYIQTAQALPILSPKCLSNRHKMHLGGEAYLAPCIMIM